jgi:hypothetical protein
LIWKQRNCAINCCRNRILSHQCGDRPGIWPGGDPNQPTPSSQGVYALVAAVGEQFSVVSEVQSTGSHLSPYRRRTIEVPNILNRLALHGLDKAIANIDPDSKRIYMALPAAQMAGVAPSEREGVAISKIVSALEKMPQRLEWGQNRDCHAGLPGIGTQRPG